MESTLPLRVYVLLEFVTTALAVVVLAAVAIIALGPAVETRSNPPVRPISLPVAVEPDSPQSVLLVLVDGPVEAAAVPAAPLSPGRDVFVIDTSVGGEASIAESLRELALREVAFEVLDLRQP